MGTQQLLMIVICVIVVAAAIAVGIAMFNQRDFNSNSQAIMAEMQVFTARVHEFWKTPKSLGGAGMSMSTTDIGALASYLGFTNSGTKDDASYIYVSDNAEYCLNRFEDFVVDFEALGYSSNNGQFPHVNLTMSLLTGTTEVEATKGKTFNNGQGHGSHNGNGTNDNNGHGNGNNDNNGNRGGNGNNDNNGHGGGSGSGDDDDDDDDDDEGQGGGNGNGHGNGNGGGPG